jgi:hypothetical protein
MRSSRLFDFKRDLYPDAYIGSRLSWILPGFAVHSIFSPVTANFLLHIGVHSVAALSFFEILRRTAGSGGFVPHAGGHGDGDRSVRVAVRVGARSAEGADRSLTVAVR